MARLNWAIVVVVVLIVAAVGFYFALQPQKSDYESYVRAFSVGVAAIDIERSQAAQESLTKAIDIDPNEPAAWADRGLLAIRDGRMDDALADLHQAEKLAPANAAIQQLLGVAEQRRGQLAEATKHFRRAVETEPKNLFALYRLAQALQQQQTADSDAEYIKLLDRMLAVAPENLFLLQSKLRAALRPTDKPAVATERREMARATVERFSKLSDNWSPTLKTTFDELKTTLAGPASQGDFAKSLPFLNRLKAEPKFTTYSDAVDAAGKLGDLVIDNFIKLPAPRHTPAEADMGLAFRPKPLSGVPEGKFDALVPAWLERGSQEKPAPPALLLANAKTIAQIGGKLDLASIPVGQQGLVPIDWNNDYRMDLLLAGSDGLRFYQQQEDGSFSDVTKKTGLPADVLGGDYWGAWAVDLDQDGDLDLVLARRSGPPLFLQNNFDGTWTPKKLFEEVNGARAFAWVDLDNDGAPDAAFIDAQGKLHLYANERSGHFAQWPVEPPGDAFLALAIADVHYDGTLSLVALRQDGALLRIADRGKRSAWDTSELAKWDKPPASLVIGAARLIVADFDNNGFPDLLVSGPDSSRLWLGDGTTAKFTPLSTDLPGNITAALDVDGTGRLDLLGLDRGGRPFRLANSGKRDYRWQVVRPVSVKAKGDTKGDNRINSYGIGGEVQVRNGSFFTKQTITEPELHFGLGDRTQADVVRVVWPNGGSQVEFSPPANSTLVALQRLKGSCPFLFAWDGQRFVFVADFMWITPLGMFINAQDNGRIGQTTEWVKIRSDRLVPKNGYYELRVNANLWETHYFDHLSLAVVDHPANTEVFVDERFSPNSTGPSMYFTSPPQPLAAVRNTRGEDVSAIVAAVDGRYLDDFPRGDYQGLATDHWVECELPQNTIDSNDGPLVLLATGWIHPTDSSINFALAQGHREQPRDLSLEIPDGHGGWKVASEHLGFPAGKNKTMVIPLDGVSDSDARGRFRLRTNMEIYWDALQIAHLRPETQAKQVNLLAETATLDYRGIVEMTQANRSSPELPNYERIESRGQVWRDLIGYHTRFGDIRELLASIDDRYAILTAGDEIALRFKAPNPPPPGIKRDFIWISDGWVKDGDLNTRFGKTVLPLPSHDATSYNTPPGRLEDDPVYKKHPEDWQNYHTRWVTPDGFERGLRGRAVEH